MKPSRIFYAILSGLIFLSMTACSGGDSSSGGTGTLSVSLTDASTDRFRAVYITVDEIQVHLGGDENNPNNWVTIDMPASPMTLNLLELANGVREDLGLAVLASGRYTQLRMILGRRPDGSINVFSQAHAFPNYVIDNNDPANIHELKVPSEYNTGVKIVNGFTINTEQTTELVLDFDACRSVVEAGSTRNWHIKPTIRAAELYELAIILGQVTTDGTNAIPGASISVQRYDTSAGQAKDQVDVETSSLTDEFGNYMIFVKPGVYNLVAYKEGNQAKYVSVTTSTDQTLETNFTLDMLNDADIGNVTGRVDIEGAGSEQYATISFRYSGMEIASLNIINGASYNLRLPAGTYTAVASSFGHTSVSRHPVNVTGAATTTMNIGM